MQNRRIISYALFAVAVLLVLAGLLVEAVGIGRGVLVGLAALVVGIIFYRRGK